MKKSLKIGLIIILAILGAGVSFIFISGLGLGLIFLLFGGLNDSPIPADEEMIQNFMAHEMEFEKIKTLALKLEDGSYYPPFSRTNGDEKDRMCDKWLTDAEKHRLDSLLNIVGSERIYYRSRKYYRGVPADSTLTLTYWSRGLSIGGTWKEYCYRPDWELMSNSGENRMYSGDETGDILKLTNYADTIIYKPIKGDWYIEFGHDN